MKRWATERFGNFLRPNSRPYILGPDEDADLVGMRLYGAGPFYRERKPALQIVKKSHFVIRAGDIIYNKLFAWKGTFGIVPPELDGMFVSDKFPTYELNCLKVEANYLRWFFRHPPLWEQARGMSTGSAALSKLTLNPPRFLDLTMPMPPLEEQRRTVKRIAELAERLTVARLLREQAITERDALLAAFRSAAFSSSLDDPTLADVCRDVTDGTHDTPRYVENGIPFLTGVNISPSGLEFSGVRNISDEDHRRFSRHCPTERGDVLLTLIGTTDKVAIVETERPFSIKNVGLLKPDPERLHSRYLFHFLQSSTFRVQAIAYAKQTAQAFIGLKKLRQARIPLPPLSEQRDISSRLDRLAKEVAIVASLQESTRSELNALLPSILDRAFKGEL